MVYEDSVRCLSLPVGVAAAIEGESAPVETPRPRSRRARAPRSLRPGRPVSGSPPRARRHPPAPSGRRISLPPRRCAESERRARAAAGRPGPRRRACERGEDIDPLCLVVPGGQGTLGAGQPQPGGPLAAELEGVRTGERHLRVGALFRAASELLDSESDLGIGSEGGLEPSCLDGANFPGEGGELGIAEQGGSEGVFEMEESLGFRGRQFLSPPRKRGSRSDELPRDSWILAFAGVTDFDASVPPCRQARRDPGLSPVTSSYRCPRFLRCRPRSPASSIRRHHFRQPLRDRRRDRQAEGRRRHCWNHRARGGWNRSRATLP